MRSTRLWNTTKDLMTSRRALNRRARLRLAALPLILLPAVTACETRSSAQAAPPPPPTVAVLTLEPETVSLSSEWIATLDGLANAQIRPQVSGYLVRRTYREGASVRKGEVLFEIDSRPFDASLEQARAELARAQADLGRTQRDVARDTPLAKEHAIPQSQLDNDVQAELSAEAAVKAAQAAVDTAQLNVGFTKVHSLIDGVAAIATAQIGDLVGPTTLLTTVSQIEPVRAYFPLGEREYLGIAQAINHSGEGKGPWSNGVGLTLTLADGTVYPRKGAFLAADREIDPKTGSIRISATFPNPDHVLRPGQYGRVSAETRLVNDALVIPQRAVADLQGTSQVRVVGSDGKIALKTVKLGARTGSRWIVEQGVQAGDRIVMDAPMLPPGTPVTTKVYVDPADAARAAANANPPAASKE